MPVVLILGKQKQDDKELKVTLGWVASWRSAQATSHPTSSTQTKVELFSLPLDMSWTSWLTSNNYDISEGYFVASEMVHTEHGGFHSSLLKYLFWWKLCHEEAFMKTGLWPEAPCQHSGWKKIESVLFKPSDAWRLSLPPERVLCSHCNGQLVFS